MERHKGSVFNPWQKKGRGEDRQMDPFAMDNSLSPLGTQEEQTAEWYATNGGENKYGSDGPNVRSASSGKWGPQWF